MKNTLLIIGGVMIIIAGVVGYNLNQPVEQLGSVGAGSVYQHTSLSANTDVSRIIKVGQGTFGSDIINVLGTGTVIFYDATTTNVNLRALATSSLPVIAYRSASQAAGTYTYDVGYYNGLIAVFDGAQGTSTVTFR